MSLSYSISTNNKFSPNIATIGNSIKVTATSDSNVVVLLNEIELIVSNTDNIYIAEQIIDNTFSEGTAEVIILNDYDTIFDNSIVITTSAPILDVTVSSNSTDIPRVGDIITINVNSDKNLYTIYGSGYIYDFN